MRDRIQEVNSVIDCLNEMYYPDVHHDFGDATVAQRACQHSLFQQLSQLPKSRDTCTEREAVQELLRCTATYEEDGCMNTVQAYDRDLVSLPEVGGVPVDLAQVLDPAGRDFVVDPVAHMMLDEEEWGHVVEQGDFVRPYMDSRLQHDPVLYGQFVKDLYEKGMLSFTAQPLEIVPPFFVRKKNGRLRLILDCRAVNLRFKRPPPLALGAGTSWAQVSLPVGEKLFVAQSDIKDYFYSLALPAELQRYFCMPAVSLSMLQALGISDDLDMHCDSEGLVFPMLRVIPMGWSWAMWLSQRVHQHLCLEASGLDISRVVVEGKAAPDISDGEVILIPYADNLNVAGIDECRVQLIKNQIVAELRRVGFRVHEEMEASCLAQSLGFLLDGERGIISPVPDRLRKVRLALNWLSRQPRVRGREVERLLGHCIHFMLLRRELLSIFRSLYDFIYSSYHKRQVLFAAAAKEARWASHLLGLCSCDLKRPWSQNVTASDASLSGIAVCKTEWPVMDVAQIGRQRESWRYKYKSKPAPRKSALNSLDPFEDVLTVKPEPVQAEDPFELNDLFEEVPEELMNPDHWHEVFAVHMQHAEHITLLEGRGIVAALRHKFRSVAEFGMKHLHFNDNMSMVLLCSKGRSGAFPMLRVCRRICSLLLATNCQLLCRWIPSEVNVADKPSRRWEHLRTGNAVGSGSGVKHQIDQACYPNRTRDARGTYPAVSWNHQEEGAAGEEVSESQAYDSPEGNTGSESCCSTRSPTLQRSDQLGATRGVTPSGAGLCQEDQRFEDLRPPAQAGSSTHPEVRRGLLHVSQLHLRARGRLARRNKVVGSGRRCFPRLWPERQVTTDQEGTSRLAQGGSPTDSSTNPMAASCSHFHEDVGQTASSLKSGGADHVLSISEAERVPFPSKERLDEAYARAQTLLPASSSQRSARGVKSRAFRRKHSTGLGDPAMVGAGPGQAGFSRSVPVQSALLQPGSPLEASIGGLRPSSWTLCSLSASSCRTQSRPAASSEECLGGQAAGSMGSRLISASLRGTRSGQPRVLPPARHGAAGINQAGRKTSKGGPKVFLPPEEIRNGHVVVELFSGCARFSRACAEKGYVSIAYDIEYGDECDLLDPKVFFRLKRFLQKHFDIISLVWMGTPCTSWSMARRDDGGPPPLRDDDQFLMGFTHLPQRDLDKIQVGNQLLQCTLNFVRLCNSLALRWVVENPFSSRIWRTRHMRLLMAAGADLHRVDFCAFGTPWKKSTGLLCSRFPSLLKIQAFCDPSCGRCKFSGKRHIILAGRDHTGQWMTRRAQPYPFQLCAQIASSLDLEVHS